MKNSFKTLDAKQNFLGIDREHSSFDSSRIVVFPVPYELSAMQKTGSKKGPQAILRASHQLETFDEETKREVPREYGIATLHPLAPEKLGEEKALQEIHEVVQEMLSLNKFIVSLGGEHSITSAIIAAYAKKITNLSVLQFDAHCNLRGKYHGDKYSSASVMARVCEYLDPSNLVQVGIRSQNRDEAEYVRDHKVNVFYAHEIHAGTYTRLLKYWDDAVVDRLSDAVYVTFDVDAFNPSLMPATGSPEPGGLSWNDVMRCLKKVGQKKKIVGFDVVEFAPLKDLRFPDVVAAKLALKIINYAF
jgi:N1-aminopropylagmatine ureohydrolase